MKNNVKVSIASGAVILSGIAILRILYLRPGEIGDLAVAVAFGISVAIAAEYFRDS